jgi:hypothetical protein
MVSTVTLLMKAIQRKAFMLAIQQGAGLGDVQVTLNGEEFYAKVFPTREAGQRQYRTLSTPMNAVDYVAYLDEFVATPVAVGTGRSVEIALSELMRQLDAKLAEEARKVRRDRWPPVR